MPSSDDWSTPKAVYDALNTEFHFTDDPCPLKGKDNGLDGLARPWGTSTFMNPPYSNPLPWCRKAREEQQAGKLVVGLLRGDTSTKWFHEYYLPFAEIRFIRGRLHFNEVGRANFASILVIWRPANVL
jgi:phage N-6-adenine-methyltransferase